MNLKTQVRIQENNITDITQFVLYAGYVFAGYVIMHNTLPELLKKELPSKYHDWLYGSGLYVSSAYRGRGYDSLLLDKMKEFVKARQKPLLIKASPLEIDRFKKEKLIRYYQMHGFRKPGINDGTGFDGFLEFVPEFIKDDA